MVGTLGKEFQGTQRTAVRKARKTKEGQKSEDGPRWTSKKPGAEP